MIWQLLAAWVLCGLVAYGLTFAHFQREFVFIAVKRRKESRSLAMRVAVSGPLGLVVIISLGFWKHGVKFW